MHGCSNIFSISAGALCVDNFIYTYGNGIVKYETSNGKIINSERMLNGCKVVSIIVDGNRIIALTDGISDISNYYIFDNRSRLLLSEDSGKSFVDVTPNYFLYDNSGEVRITALGGSPTDLSHIVACVTSNSTLPQYFESTDLGKTWQFYTTGDYGYAQYIEFLTDSNEIWAITRGSSMTDEISKFKYGKGWRSYDTEQFPVLGFFSNIVEPNNLPYYTQKSIKISHDDGLSWKSSDLGKDLESISKYSQINSIIKDEHIPNTLYAIFSESRNVLFPDVPLKFYIAKTNNGGNFWKEIDKGEIKIDYNPSSLSIIKVGDYFYIIDETNILSTFPVVDNTEIREISSDSSDVILYKDGEIVLPEDCSQYIIYDYDAKIVKSGTVTDRSISVSSLSEGSYIVVAKTQNGHSITKKVIISH